MKRIALSVLVILLSTQIVFAELIKGSFLMTEFEDGKQTEDLFEIWTIKANLSSTNPQFKYKQLLLYRMLERQGSFHGYMNQLRFLK